MGRNHPNKIVITDASVLINFLKINRVDLLDSFPGKFLITDHVLEEVTHGFPEQKIILQNAIDAGMLEVVVIDNFMEIQLFNELVRDGRLGAGECSAIACAINRDFILLIDDIRACKQAKKLAPDLETLSTLDIMLELIKINVIKTEDLKNIREDWKSNHKFYLKIDFV